MNLPSITRDIDLDWASAQKLIQDDKHRDAVYYLGRMKELINIVAQDVIRVMETKAAEELEAKKHKHNVI
jgi:hypothetical protein